MKKLLLLVVVASAIGFAGCKKDRVCECTTTRVSSSGNTTTDPAPVPTTYKEIKKRDAKSLCQKYTSVDVNPNGGTTTWTGDCELK